LGRRRFGGRHPCLMGCLNAAGPVTFQGTAPNDGVLASTVEPVPKRQPILSAMFAQDRRSPCTSRRTCVEETEPVRPQEADANGVGACARRELASWPNPSGSGWWPEVHNTRVRGGAAVNTGWCSLVFFISTWTVFRGRNSLKLS
jgi:hypothetical protein